MNAWTPEVIAHRGASVAEPEHTPAAYRRAVEMGADAVECDVRLSADGHLVCVHDRTVDRTSTGRGPVSMQPLARLEALDWGAWRAPHLPPDPDRSRLLTLRELLGYVRDCGRDVRVAVETKHPTRYGSLVERALAEVLAEFGWASPATRRDAVVRVMSFSGTALRRMRRSLPAVPRVLLLDRVPVRGTALPAAAGTAGVSLQVLRRHPGYVDGLRRSGVPVHVWVVDDPADVELCRHRQVDGIITNRPDVVLACLGRG